MNLPTISCLCLSLNRLVQLKEAIRCYCDQSYPNKELIILSEGSKRYKAAIQAHMDTLDRKDIRFIPLEGKDYSLGKLRNISVEAAQGEIICQWDDDDLNHPERLKTQASFMFNEQAGACCMTDQLQYFWESRELFWVNWWQERLGGYHRLIPGTLMMFKDQRFKYPEDGSRAHAGEDSAFLESFYDKIKIAPLKDVGHLYVYTFHGSNTFDQSHHEKISLLYGMHSDEIWKREQLLKEVLPYYRLSVPISILSKNRKTVFSLTYAKKF